MQLPDIDTVWNYREPAATERKFADLVPKADGAYLAELLTQLARAQGLQGKFTEAHTTLDRAEKQLTPDMKRPRVRLLLERGRLFNSADQPTRALPLFQQAADLARTAGESRLAVDAVHMIAIAEPDPAKKIEWNLKGIELARQLNQPGWLPALYNNLGEACFAKHDYAGALKAFQDLSDLDRKAGRDPDVYAQKDVAKALRHLCRIDEALAILRPIDAKLTKEGQPNPFIDEELAECLLAQGKDADAKPHFVRAYEGQKEDEWVVKHEPAKLERLKRLAGR